MLTIHGIIDMTNPDKFDHKIAMTLSMKGTFQWWNGNLLPAGAAETNTRSLESSIGDMFPRDFFLQKTFLTSKLVHHKSKLHHPHSTITPQPATIITTPQAGLSEPQSFFRHGVLMRSSVRLKILGPSNSFCWLFWEEFMTVMLFSLRDRASLILRYVYIHLYVQRTCKKYPQ